ncbi:MAG: peptidylprolyl isomerase [Chitinivibrionales bacterium]|nr:peptidylprolyl isomerase [Chitinivibrionales bacterium]
MRTMGVVFVLALSCFSFSWASSSKQGNIFADTTLQHIYTIGNLRSGGGLVRYFKNNDSLYRMHALIVLSSVQDSTLVDSCVPLLSDKSQHVRSAAAYALGQIRSPRAEPALLQAFYRENSVLVKKDICEALGKCGTVAGLNFLLTQGVSLGVKNSDSVVQTGVAWGIYRFMLQNVTSDASTKAMVNGLASTAAYKVRFIASYYLGRIKNVDLTPFADLLLKAAKTEKDPLIKIQIIGALAKTKSALTLTFLTNLLGEKSDYRLAVAALRSMASFDFTQTKKYYLEQVLNPQTNIATIAADNLKAATGAADVPLMFSTGLKAPFWYARAALLSAACAKASGDSTVTAIVKTIVSFYEKSTNKAEKALLLAACAADPHQIQFIAGQAHQNLKTAIATAGYQALVDNIAIVKTNDTLKNLYAQLLKQAIQTGDCGVIATVAGALRSPEIDFKKNYPDHSFLATALVKLKIPAEIEAYNELAQTVEFFTAKPQSKPVLKNRPIDWTAVAAIPAGQKAVVKTSIGTFTIELAVNQSPVSTAHFVELAKIKFFDGLTFHRVVPNFVVQGGDPRGDGYGAGDYSIASEFGPMNFNEGSIGMASSGKDTECFQWFVTHIPTPHLDGKYSNFGTVISGMDIIGKLEIGDTILSVTLAL